MNIISQQSMEGVFSSDPEVLPTNIPYMAVCSSVALFLAVILLVYQFKFNDSPPIVSILALLLFNQLVMLLFEIPGYFAYIPNWVCLTSIVGTTFFRLAQYYWLFFVTRLLYREKAAPGKLKDLSSYIRKNVVFTYFPSVVVSVVVLVVANIEDTISEANCWHLIKERTYSDYIIYLSCFILPNLLSLVATLIYFIAFFVIQSKAKKSICIYFPITALPFMIYDLVLRMLTFFGEFQSNQLEDIPLVCHPLAHGIIFLIVLRNLYLGKKLTSSDLTIHEESQKIQSFLIPHPEQIGE